MYKSSLQELCQSKKWKLPQYTTSREGLDHCPVFGATVVVHESTFSTPQFSRSAKEAQNLVAKIAYHFFTGTSSVGASNAGAPNACASNACASQVPVTFFDAQKNTSIQPSNASFPTEVNVGNKDDKIVKDMAHLYKNQLQTYAQKRNLSLPEYISEREGPHHALRFKAAVMLGGKTYQSSEYFSTLKDAENAAAKSALMLISSDDGTEEEDPGFFKNLLQELAQRDYCCLPVYNTIRSGPSHDSVFVSTVKINEACFTGREAKTKKLAELYAAKVAYNALKERSSSGCHVNDSSPMLRAAELPDKHISEQNPESNAPYVFKELVRCNEGVHGQGNEVKLTEKCPCRGQLYEPEKDAIPFLQAEPSNSPGAHTQHLASFGVGGPSSSSRHGAASSHKRIKVFPATPNMTFPEGVLVMRKDDKWVAITMDPS